MFSVIPKNKEINRGNIDHGNTLRYRLAEIQPLDANENSFLNYPQHVSLDRIAISKNKLKLVQRGGSEIMLRM